MKAKFLSIVLLIALFWGIAAVQPGYAQDTTPTVGLNQTGILVAPSTDAKSGVPGTIVTYTLQVTNNTTAPITLAVTTASISGSGSGWSVLVNQPSLSLVVGETKSVDVKVAVPDVAPGAMNVTAVIFSDGTTELGRSTLTTTAAAPVITPSPSMSGRPLLVLDSYSVGADSIKAGSQFDLTLRVRNNGQDFGKNVVLTFSGSEFMPVETGGVRSLSEIDPGERLDVVQPFIASSSLFGVKYGSITVNVSYTDLAGAATYTETFTITISLSQPSSSGGVARPTATPTAVSRPQLVVSNYETDVEPLQPGSMFTLDLIVTNLGNADARTVTMVLGGGSADTGTPGAGGVSGGGSDLSTFAPLGSSNLVFLGDLPAGASKEISVPLVVNVTANPAAYAFKISFVFDDTKGVRQSNDQIITLLVFQLPQVEIGFYRDPGVFMTGNMNMLPLQITNLGRKSAVLGNIKVTAQNADVTNNVSLVGALEPGGYFTLDANVMPYQAGPLDLEVTVNYTDDFNQQRVIVQNMSVEVQEMPAPEPMPEGQDPNFPTDGNGSSGNETLWQKIVRFFKGLFGLDSSPSVPETPIEEIPIEPLPGNSKPIQPGPKG